MTLKTIFPALSLFCLISCHHPTEIIPMDPVPQAGFICPDTVLTGAAIPLQNTTQPATCDNFTWFFGEGSSPVQDKAPVHVFDQPGIVKITLIAITDSGSDTTARTVLVLVPPPPPPPPPPLKNIKITAIEYDLQHWPYSAGPEIGNDLYVTIYSKALDTTISFRDQYNQHTFYLSVPLLVPGDDFLRVKVFDRDSIPNEPIDWNNPNSPHEKDSNDVDDLFESYYIELSLRKQNAPFGFTCLSPPYAVGYYYGANWEIMPLNLYNYVRLQGEWE